MVLEALRTMRMLLHLIWEVGVVAAEIDFLNPGGEDVADGEEGDILAEHEPLVGKDAGEWTTGEEDNGLGGEASNEWEDFLKGCESILIGHLEVGTDLNSDLFQILRLV
tara:strand:+ start:974 stop:1300 length:327 start_codon:yes stop_codon:yes gene_type:complete